jgi:zinc/manganese transport system substrate-binding protein
MRTILISLILILPACGGASTPGQRGALKVVASTNVYGDIAQQIGGASVEVTSILTNPDADPHLFEPGTRTGLAVSNAAVLIQNGLGYDDFVRRLAEAAPNGDRRVVTVADVLGVHGAKANPHLWYDIPRLPAVAAAIADALALADPANEREYQAGLRKFDGSLQPLLSTIAAIRKKAAGAAVAYTEPVPGYLLEAAGLRNIAPSSFTHAIEAGTEPPPAAVAEMQALIRDHRVKALLYNNQAVSPITIRLRSTARAAGTPVVGVSETIPPNLSFQRWQLDQTQALARAVTG